MINSIKSYYFTPTTKEELICAINLWCNDKKSINQILEY